jgi:two-component system response regulator AtoC
MRRVLEIHAFPDGYRIDTLKTAEGTAALREESVRTGHHRSQDAGAGRHLAHAKLRKIIPDVPVIVITAFGSIETAVEAMKEGAFDYITNRSIAKRSAFWSRGVESWRTEKENAYLRQEVSDGRRWMI